MAGADFSRQIVETIAKRAANYCSNPDCGVLTCGPSETDNGSVTLGEAAHIYGARSGSARFVETMSDQERGDVTNAIWLCRNCHKIIDNDPTKHPAELLFEWRREHESEIAARLGKRGDILRQKVLTRELAEFAGCSYLAQQIVIDRPPFWEFKLTIELLRAQLAPVMARWRALRRGLYSKPAAIVSELEMLPWLQAHLAEVRMLAAAYDRLINEELSTSWGPPGQPGDPKEILRACSLLTECAQQVLRWEEDVHFAATPQKFDQVRTLLTNSAGRILDQIARIPPEMGAIFEQENPQGNYHIKLVLEMPEGWGDELSAAIRALAE